MMKRLFCMMMAILMLCSMLVMTACTETEPPEETTTAETTTAETTTAETTTAETTTAETTTAETTTAETTTAETTTAETTTAETTTVETTTEEEKPIVKIEWATYDDGEVSFSYPKSWMVMDGLAIDMETANMITVASETKTDKYTNLDEESFKNEMVPSLEGFGMTVADISVEQTATNGLPVTVISYSLTSAGARTMQKMIAATAGDMTYVILLTEVKEDASLFEMLFDTLIITPSEQGADEYTIYDNGDISFSYPRAWEKTESMGVLTLASENGNNITITEELQTDAYMNMTAEEFGSQLKTIFEMMGISVTDLTLEVCENANGVPMTVIAYSLEIEDFWMGQTLFIVNAGESTYTITITEVMEDAELIVTVFDSLTIVA